MPLPHKILALNSRNQQASLPMSRTLVRHCYLEQKSSESCMLQPQAAPARLHNTNQGSQHMQLLLLNPLHRSQQKLLHLAYAADQLHQLQPLLSLPPDPLLVKPHLQHSPLRTSALLNLQHNNLLLQVLAEPEVLALLLLHLTLMMIAHHQKMMQATILVTYLLPVPHLNHSEDVNP